MSLIKYMMLYTISYDDTIEVNTAYTYILFYM